MPWPPQVGELLPRWDEPEGIDKKLSEYSLDLDHRDGGPKAKGFLVMLGIDLKSTAYLAAEIRRGIAHTPISLVVPKEAGVTVIVGLGSGPDGTLTNLELAHDWRRRC